MMLNLQQAAQFLQREAVSFLLESEAVGELGRPSLDIRRRVQVPEGICERNLSDTTLSRAGNSRFLQRWLPPASASL